MAGNVTRAGNSNRRPIGRSSLCRYRDPRVVPRDPTRPSPPPRSARPPRPRSWRRGSGSALSCSPTPGGFEGTLPCAYPLALRLVLKCAQVVHALALGERKARRHHPRLETSLVVEVGQRRRRAIPFVAGYADAQIGDPVVPSVRPSYAQTRPVRRRRTSRCLGVVQALSNSAIRPSKPAIVAGN